MSFIQSLKGTFIKLQFRTLSMQSNSDSLGPVASVIYQKLTEAFNPTHLNIIDESHKHAGHSAMKHHDRTQETHFKVVVVSDYFQDKMPIDRHRAINDCLKEELQSGVHALSIEAKTQK